MLLSINAKSILLVCGCEKYREYLDAAVSRFAHPSWRVIGVVGGGTGAAQLQGDVLTLPVRDNYEALPIKIHAAFEWIIENHPETPGVFKTDDDIVIEDNSELAVTIASYIEQNVLYAGIHVGQCRAGRIRLFRIQQKFDNKDLRPRHQAAFYCFGHGYWIGQAAISYILDAKHDFEQSYGLEDICMGHVLNRAGIYPISMPVTYHEAERNATLLTGSQ